MTNIVKNNDIHCRPSISLLATLLGTRIFCYSPTRTLLEVKKSYSFVPAHKGLALVKKMTPWQNLWIPVTIPCCNTLWFIPITNPRNCISEETLALYFSLINCVIFYSNIFIRCTDYYTVRCSHLTSPYLDSKLEIPNPIQTGPHGQSTKLTLLMLPLTT